MKRSLATLLVASGCLSVPDKAQPICTEDSDCGGSGEVCSEGVCYGDPPPGMFAAVLVPPSTRADLVPIEMPAIALPSDGDLGALPLQSPGTFSGQLMQFCVTPNDCTSRGALGATITITHPSAIPNGQAFRAVVNAASGISTSSTQFQVVLPQSTTPYTVLIVPEGRGAMPDGTTTAAQLVPPLRTTVMIDSADSGKDTTITLGSPNLAFIDGTLTNSAGFGLGGYRIAALGHWEANADSVECSTVDYTGSDGKFHLVVANNLVGTLEIVAKPYGALAPTLHLANLDAAQPPTGLYMVAPATAGNDKVIDVHVTAADGSGKKVDVSGARVTIDGSAATGGPQIGKYATLTASDTTDATGLVHLHVLDGALLATTYAMRIVPPASSISGVIYEQPVTLGPMEVTLPSRVAIRGIVADANGDPLLGVSVTATPSLEFAWNLEGNAQQFLTEIPAATTTTPNTGEFVIWVDPVVSGVFGHYALQFEPSDTTAVPQWQTLVDMPRDNSTSVSLDTLKIPAPSFMHGHLVDPMGADVADGELKLFQVVTSTALCDMVAHAPTGCPIPAPLVGRGTSDMAGALRLSVPRP